METVPISSGDGHQFVWLGSGDPTVEKGVASNQYAIIDGGEAMLLDPGGYHTFERVFTNITKLVKPENITRALLSHQDPDVAASIVSWLEIQPKMEVYISALWDRFLPHFALPNDAATVLLPDEGKTIALRSGARVRFVPAHGLHSPGNFMAYDEKTRILFSGDLGAALVPAGDWTLFVEDFTRHVGYMDGFHRRFLASTKAIRAFLKRIEGLPIDMICPQHGSIFRGADVQRFFTWLSKLEVGFDYRSWGDAG